MELDVGYQIPDTKIMPGIAVEEEILGVLSCLLPNNLVFHQWGLFSQWPPHLHSCSIRIPGIPAPPLNRGSVQFSGSVVSNSLWPHGLQHTRLSFPSPAPGACSNSCPLSLWCHPTVSSLSSPFPSAFNLSQHHSLFHWVNSLHQVAKVLEFQLQHQSFQWIFRTDFL